MRQYLNQRKVNLYNKLSKAMIIIGLILLISSLVLSFTRPETMNQLLITVIVGTLVSQAGLALFNNWGKQPRIDQIFDGAFKGLDNRYAIFHYKLGASHALICPAGVYALIPRQDDGEITYSDGKWWEQVRKRGLFRRSGRKRLNRIEDHAKAQARIMQQSIQKALPETDISVQPILVFISKDALVKVDHAPILTVHIKKLKSAVRRLPKVKSLDAVEIERLAKAVGF
jgi:hypothetical protein